LTGGEPLVRKDLLDIVKDLKEEAGFEQIAITTNGTLLKRKLPKLFEAGVTHLNISMDSLIPSKNEYITRRPNTSKAAMQGIDLALSLGMPSVKLNVVAMRNFNCDEFGDFA
jgi:cyclic pyranopterin phosphate synthase